MANSDEGESSPDLSITSRQSKDQNVPNNNRGSNWRHAVTEETWKCTVTLAKWATIIFIQGFFRAFIVIFAFYTESVKTKPDWPGKHTLRGNIVYAPAMCLPYLFLCTPAIGTIVKTLSLRTMVKEFRSTIPTAQKDQHAFTISSAKWANTCYKIAPIAAVNCKLVPVASVIGVLIYRILRYVFAVYLDLSMLAGYDRIQGLMVFLDTATYITGWHYLLALEHFRVAVARTWYKQEVTAMETDQHELPSVGIMLKRLWTVAGAGAP
ncbi:uncharacterized protein LOC129589671 [Paramacrobiotus metropolitanus]|uniref:uncharacterized protein LOC129589671 n=1 Tax=Paramacrobiotus metropolitanus TaxID=2943436 RepID=UPI00244643A3|nr:uncharacterized protein LOC129589671 [Paramacrobiotus metropolitanus]